MTTTLLRLKTLLLVSVFALLVRVSAWGQSGFATSVAGTAWTRCGTQTYNIQPAPRDTSGDASSSRCPAYGTAESETEASLGLSVSSSCHVTGTASCASSFNNYDTATMQPPEGFSGNSVDIGFEDNFSRMSGENASVAVNINWLVGSYSLNEAVSTNGTHASTITAPSIPVQEPFTFEIDKTGNSTYETALKSGEVRNASFATTGFHLVLPKGWTCSYASGQTCP
jgi:hypothetical protein